MPIKRRPEKLLEVAYASARANGLGPMKAISYSSDAITLAVALAVAHIREVGQDGEWPTQVEYAAHYGMTERTAQREWARYRQVFGEKADPYVMAEWLVSVAPGPLARIAQAGKPDEGLDLAVGLPAGGLVLAGLA